MKVFWGWYRKSYDVINSFMKFCKLEKDIGRFINKIGVWIL